MKRIMSLFIYFIFLNQSYAWSPNVHMVIANIAYDRLTPTARVKIDQMVNDFSHEYPHTNTFILLARWADDIKGQNISLFSHWHYIDVPFSQDNTPLKEISDTDNILWALSNIQPIMQNEHANPYERARFLAFFVHCLSDLHQPLHTTSRISQKYPYGDQGGNLYTVQFPDAAHTTSLHRLWDNGFNIYTGDAKPETIQEWSDYLTKHYPEAYFATEIQNINFNDWQDEGYQLSITFVYDTPENKIPSADYTNKGKEIIEQRVTLAGYRVAYLLNKLLS